MDTEGHQNATPNAADRFDIPERFLLYYIIIHTRRNWNASIRYMHTCMYLHRYKTFISILIINDSKNIKYLRVALVRYLLRNLC